MPAAWGSSGDTGCDADTDVVESTQLLHHGIHLPCVRSPGVKNRFRIIKDYHHLLRGQERPQGCQTLGIFDPRADDIGEPAEEVRARWRELVTTNESTVMAKPLLDSIVVEDGQGDGRLADSPSTDEGDWSTVLGEIDYLLDQLVASEEGPWR